MTEFEMASIVEGVLAGDIDCMFCDLWKPKVTAFAVVYDASGEPFAWECEDCWQSRQSRVG